MKLLLLLLGESLVRVVQFSKINFIMLISNTNFVYFYDNMDKEQGKEEEWDPESVIYSY